MAGMPSVTLWAGGHAPRTFGKVMPFTNIERSRTRLRARANAVVIERATSDVDRWMSATQRGDHEAFGHVFDACAADINAWFRARCLSLHTAADLTAETFAVALSDIAKWRPAKGPGRAWLFGIARNQWRRYCRRGDVDRRARARLGIPTEIVDDFTDQVCAHVDASQLSTRLRSSWDELTPTVAAAVALRVLDGHDFDTVAHTLGISEAAARKRVARGLAFLAADLDRQDQFNQPAPDPRGTTDEQHHM